MGHGKRATSVLYDHMQFDPGTPGAVTLVTQMGLRNQQRIEAIDPDLNRRVIGSVPDGHPATYLHSFAMTEHYVVVPLHPVAYAMPSMIWTGRYRDAFRWYPEKGTTFVVVDRQTGRIHSTHQADSFFFWHTVNAYERGGSIVVDIVAADTARAIYDVDIDKLRDPDHRPQFYGTLRRYELPLAGGPATCRQLSETWVEFPRINDARNTRHYQYAYAYAIGYRDADSDWFDQIVKIDTDSGADQCWFEDGCYTSEPIFVARPGGEREDDGVILNVVLDSRAGTSFLLVLDAATMNEVARAVLPHHIPFNFHSQYYS